MIKRFLKTLIREVIEEEIHKKQYTPSKKLTKTEIRGWLDSHVIKDKQLQKIGDFLQYCNNVKMKVKIYFKNEINLSDAYELPSLSCSGFVGDFETLCDGVENDETYKYKDYVSEVGIYFQGISRKGSSESTFVTIADYGDERPKEDYKTILTALKKFLINNFPEKLL